MSGLADRQGSNNKPPEVLSLAQKTQLQSNDGKSSLILRIKRKRGTDPISALRIESLLSKGIDPSQVEEHARSLQGGEPGSPEDRAEASSRPKRRLTERGIFRLADTISVATFETEASTKRLEQRITDLKNAPAAAPVQPPNPPERTTLEEDTKSTPKSSEQTAREALENTLRFKIIKPAISKGKQDALGNLKSKSSSSSLRSRAVHAKYNRNAGKGSISSLRKSSEASILTRKNTSSSRIRFIDAVMERSKIGVKQKGGKDEVSSDARKVAATSKSSDAEMDSLDRRFADLLGSYLKENDLQPPKDLYDSSIVADSHRQADSSDEDSEEDYVYDIYFREKETMWGSGPAGASDAGLRPAEVAGHEDLGPSFEISAEAQYTEPMATLVGFSDEDDLITEMESASILMGQENFGDSDDEFDEGEDEDSNDEGFYRNDYPEDEGAEEDEMNQAGWGWTGPRRRNQRQSSDEEDEDESDSNDSGSDLHN